MAATKIEIGRLGNVNSRLLLRNLIVVTSSVHLNSALTPYTQDERDTKIAITRKT